MASNYHLPHQVIFDEEFDVRIRDGHGIWVGVVHVHVHAAFQPVGHSFTLENSSTSSTSKLEQLAHVMDTMATKTHIVHELRMTLGKFSVEMRIVSMPLK